MTRIRAVQLVAAGVLVIAGGCSATPSGGASVNTSELSGDSGVEASPDPNTNAGLSDKRAVSQECNSMDDLLEQALSELDSGKEFITASKAWDEADNANEFDRVASELQGAWLNFVGDFWDAYQSEFDVLAAADKQARSAYDAMKDYVGLAPSFYAGEIPQFDDPEAMEKIAAGEDVDVNPEFTHASERLSDDVAAISICLPTWPVMF
ncbi:MAG: hypothetical protein PUK40_01605 [Actinomycetaceae bacterium]|nr:hypothetical protein [Arcanobacterium sp.]MDD7504639.1 hypothetical protein [Actinomycetaceae bacterium]MDY6142642.1 hypothetical protein [Arcanobacterium sp.]